MVLNLPAHTQKQLATMAGSPPPSPSPQATPFDQYRLNLAQRYRQQIQQIMEADLLAQDPDAIIPAPITTGQIPARMLASELEVSSDSDDDELLPPYAEDDGSSSDCTVTVQELDSPETPSDTVDASEPQFFTNYTASPHLPIMHVAEIQPKQLTRARPVIAHSATTAKKAGVSVSEKPCREQSSSHHFNLRPRSRGDSCNKHPRPDLTSPRNSSKMRKQLAAIFSGSIRVREQHAKSSATKPAVVRSTAVV